MANKWEIPSKALVTPIDGDSLNLHINLIQYSTC